MFEFRTFFEKSLDVEVTPENFYTAVDNKSHLWDYVERKFADASASYWKFRDIQDGLRSLIIHEVAQ